MFTRSMRPDYELGALAARQASYLSSDQAIAHGLTPGAIRWRLDQGLWTSVRNGLYQVPGIPHDFMGKLRAATAILPLATVSHEAAAELHEFPFVPRGKAAVTVHARTTHSFPGVTVRRSLDLLPDHVTNRRDLPTTSVARTLVDLAAVCHRRMVSQTMDDLLASGRVRISEVVDVFEQVARPGRTGSASMRALLAERVGDELVTASRLEQVGMQLFKRGGLPIPEWQYRAPWNEDERIDFAWPRWLAGVEGDGRRWHTRAADFERDRGRDRLALLCRWSILRFTWHDFTQRSEQVLGQVRALLEQQQRILG